MLVVNLMNCWEKLADTTIINNSQSAIVAPIQFAAFFFFFFLLWLVFGCKVRFRSHAVTFLQEFTTIIRRCFLSHGRQFVLSKSYWWEDTFFCPLFSRTVIPHVTRAAHKLPAQKRGEIMALRNIWKGIVSRLRPNPNLEPYIMPDEYRKVSPA